MFLLTSIFDEDRDSFDYKGKILHTDMAFDNILRVYELFMDKDFNNSEKVLISLEMLIKEFEEIEHLDFTEMLDIYFYVLKEFLDIDFNKKDEAEEKEDIEGGESPSVKSMDFSKDAGLIYASFLSEYNIDLFEAQGKLHWDKFSELLSYLGDKTAFKQVVSYRTMKVPTRKETTEEHRKHILKMKELYSLEEPGDKKEILENTLDTIASTFAKGGGK